MTDPGMVRDLTTDSSDSVMPTQVIGFVKNEDGTTSLVITLPGENLGMDAGQLITWFGSVFWALENLRGNVWTPNTSQIGREDNVGNIGIALGNLDNNLFPRLAGLSDALIRMHYANGGSHGRLALALDVKRTTAQSKYKRLSHYPSVWEEWAHRR